MQATKAPNLVDVHVGRRVRLRRKELEISQERLAEGLGLTFQQVQKYERGANRVSASKLYEMARVLRVSIGYFFEGLDDPASPIGDNYASAYNSVIEEMLAEPNPSPKGRSSPRPSSASAGAASEKGSRISRARSRPTIRRTR